MVCCDALSFDAFVVNRHSFSVGNEMLGQFLRNILEDKLRIDHEMDMFV
jgi:hypothetical protein